MPPFDRAHTTSYLTFINNSDFILCHFRDIAKFLSSVVDFRYATCIWCHRWDDPVRIQ